MPPQLLLELILHVSDHVGMLLLLELRARHANLHRSFEAKREFILANSNLLVCLLRPSLLFLALSVLPCL